MRVCQITSSFLPNFIGGREKHVMVLSKALARLGVNVEVVTGDHVKKVKIEKPFDGMSVIRVPLKILPLPSRGGWIKYKVAPLMSWILNKRDVDLFHAHDYYHFSTDIVTRIAKKRNKPLVLTVHSRPSFFPISRHIKDLYYKILGRKTLDYASKVIFVAKTTMQEYIKMGLEPEKTVVIPPAIDINELMNYKFLDRNFFFERYGIEKQVLLICVGRVEKRKGFQYIMSILPELTKEIPELMVIIVGPDGGYLKYLKNLAKKLRVENRVLFTGPLNEEDLRRAITSANIFLLPSEDEGFPEVLLVAMGLGKPVIAMNVGDVHEIVIHNKTGLLVEHKNLLEAILKLIFNEKFAFFLAKNGQKMIASNFSAERMATETIKIYNMLLSKRRS